jgi:hypothetical protein
MSLSSRDNFGKQVKASRLVEAWSESWYWSIEYGEAVSDIVSGWFMVFEVEVDGVSASWVSLVGGS